MFDRVLTTPLQCSNGKSSIRVSNHIQILNVSPLCTGTCKNEFTDIDQAC